MTNIAKEAAAEVAATNAALAAKGGTSNRPVQAPVKGTQAVQPKGKPAKAPAKAPAKPALTAIQVARANVAAKAKQGVGVTVHTSGKPIKGLAPEPVVAKPQRKMLRTIAKIKGHPGVGNCVKRFHLYKEGMTLLDCKTTEGLVVSDVTFYATRGYLTLRDATDAEYNAAVTKWEQGKVREEKAKAKAQG